MVLLTRTQKALIRETFVQVAPQLNVLGRQFYQHLLNDVPGLPSLFAEVNLQTQGHSLFYTLSLAVGLLDDADELHEALCELGTRHRAQGVCPEHYDVFGAVLIDVLAEATGPAFTPEVREAWATLYAYMAQTIQDC